MNKYLSRNLLASSILSAMLASQAYAYSNNDTVPAIGSQASAEQTSEPSANQTDASKKKAVQLQNVTVTAQRRQELVLRPLRRERRPTKNGQRGVSRAAGTSMRRPLPPLTVVGGPSRTRTLDPLIKRHLRRRTQGVSGHVP